jgi:hypothetical protein
MYPTKIKKKTSQSLYVLPVCIIIGYNEGITLFNTVKPPLTLVHTHRPGTRTHAQTPYLLYCLGDYYFFPL